MKWIENTGSPPVESKAFRASKGLLGGSRGRRRGHRPCGRAAGPIAASRARGTRSSCGPGSAGYRGRNRPDPRHPRPEVRADKEEPDATGTNRYRIMSRPPGGQALGGRASVVVGRRGEARSPVNQKIPPNSSMVSDVPFNHRSGWDRLVASAPGRLWSSASSIAGFSGGSSLARIFAVGSTEATYDYLLRCRRTDAQRGKKGGSRCPMPKAVLLSDYPKGSVGHIT